MLTGYKLSYPLNRLPMISKSISLTKIELSLAETIGLARYHANRQQGVHNARVGNQSNAFTDINAMAGEIAFCKMFNRYPDMSVDEHPVYDVLMFGCTVDVKTTRYDSGKLLATLKCAGKPCDYYSLMVGDYTKSNNFDYRGSTTGHELFSKNNIGSLGYGDTYIINQSNLREVTFKCHTMIFI